MNLLAIAFICLATQPAQGEFNDLTAPVEPILRALPHVAEVKTLVRVDKPTARIIHIADYHFVLYKDFATDIRDQAKKPVSDAVISRLYAEHLERVQRVKEQQKELLRALIKRHGLKRVFLEGLTERDKFVFQIKISLLRKQQREMEELAFELAVLTANKPTDKETFDLIDKMQSVLGKYAIEVMRIGAAGQLFMSGELKEVLPLEDYKAYTAARPLRKDGTVVFDEEANDARQQAQVRNMLKHGSVAVVVLGGAHDLSENVQRESAKCEYVVVKAKDTLDSNGG